MNSSTSSYTINNHIWKLKQLQIQLLDLNQEQDGTNGLTGINKSGINTYVAYCWKTGATGSF